MVDGGETRTVVSGATKFTVGGEEGMHKNYGRVPKYINKYNQARADEAERRRAEEEQARQCPPGTKLMPDEDRLATLEQLKQSKVEITNILEKMPIVLQTHSSQRKQKDLE